MKNQIRAFIAIDLSEAVRSTIAKLIRSLRSKIDGTKWVEPENLHLTLKFLGDIPINDLHRLIAAMNRAAAQIEPFDLEFLGCGAFPQAEHPKTVWIGCDQGSEELTRLARVVEDEMFQLGFPRENRRFSPHLTIGRVKWNSKIAGTNFADFFEEQKLRPFGSCGVDQFVLYSSELTRRGPIYDELAVASLR